MSALQDAGCRATIGGRRFDGCWALFLDRDGVIVEEANYLGRPEDVRLIAGAAAVIAACNAAGVAVVVVTNQSGVARGYFDWPAFDAVQSEIARQLAKAGAHWDAAFACAYHRNGRGDLALADHPWRKPNPGMLLAAEQALGVSLARSVIVGDRASDLAAGKAAGLGLGVQVATGHGRVDEQVMARALASPGFEVRFASDLGAAADVVDRLAATARC